MTGNYAIPYGWKSTNGKGGSRGGGGGGGEFGIDDTTKTNSTSKLNGQPFLELSAPTHVYQRDTRHKNVTKRRFASNVEGKCIEENTEFAKRIITAIKNGFRGENWKPASGRTRSGALTKAGSYNNRLEHRVK